MGLNLAWVGSNNRRDRVHTFSCDDRLFICGVRSVAGAVLCWRRPGFEPEQRKREREGGRGRESGQVRSGRQTRQCPVRFGDGMEELTVMT
jgi:hypothetical protein